MMEWILWAVDFVLHLDVHLAELIRDYGIWIYAILFIIVFLETGVVVTPFLPGDSLLFIAGALAAVTSDDFYTLERVIAVLLVAAILGDMSNYWIGRKIGKKVFEYNGRWIKQEALLKAQAFYEKHGGKTIIVARFLPIIRTFAPFVAGIGKMHYKRFQGFNVVGALLWVLSLTITGYFFGNLPIVKNNLSFIIVGIVFVSMIPVALAHLMNKNQPTPKP